jgi:hypothetical protein
MPISPADLRGMLRADAVGLVLGVLLVLAAMVTLVLVGVLRRRAVSLLWLAAFSLVYECRLLERAAIFRLSFDLPTSFWNRVDAAITYSVPIPIALFARATFPAWRRFWTTGAIGLTVFAIFGIVSDATLGQSHSAIAANNVIAIGFFVSLLGWIFRPGQTPSRELHTIRIGALTVSVAAVADNLRGMEAVAFPGPDLEPFGFTASSRVSEPSRFRAWSPTRGNWSRSSESSRSPGKSRPRPAAIDATHARSHRSGAISADERRRR